MTCCDMCEHIGFAQGTKASYTALTSQIVPDISNFFVAGGETRILIYNLSHSLKPQIKRNILKVCLWGLPTRDKLSHFTSESNLCRLCKNGKESREHLLQYCPVSINILKFLRRQSVRLRVGIMLSRKRRFFSFQPC